MSAQKSQPARISRDRAVKKEIKFEFSREAYPDITRESDLPQESLTEFNLTLFQKLIDYRFNDELILRRALTRLAYAKENSLPEDDYMDAYATLGDAVIDVVVIERLVIVNKDHDKGVITTKKTDLVNMTRLRNLASGLGLQNYVLWGKGEKQQHIWTSGRVLAESVESICGAMYLDGGIAAVREFLEKLDFSARRICSSHNRT
jgi:dsRNA-specific ribonuclease